MAKTKSIKFTIEISNRFVIDLLNTYFRIRQTRIEPNGAVKYAIQSTLDQQLAKIVRHIADQYELGELSQSDMKLMYPKIDKIHLNQSYFEVKEVE